MIIDESDCDGPAHFNKTGHIGPYVINKIIGNGGSAFFEPLPEGVHRIMIIVSDDG